MNLAQLYREKHHTKEEALTFIQPESDIITPILAGEPYALMKQLETYEGLEGNRLFQMFSTRDVLDVNPEKLKITSMFMGAAERKAFQEGKLIFCQTIFPTCQNPAANCQKASGHGCCVTNG